MGAEPDRAAAVLLRERLEAVLRQAGAVLVGVGSLQGVSSRWPVGVAAAIPLPGAIVRQIAAGPTLAYWQTYQALNARLDAVGEAGEAFLRQNGYAAFAQTTRVIHKDARWNTPLPHKTVATRAGLGWIGKSCLLVTPEYGSAVRITSLLTDAPLPADEAAVSSRCGGCRVCQQACPAGALSGALWRPGLPREALLNKEACQAKQLERMKERTGLEVALCGKCFEVCPYTQAWLQREAEGRN